MDTVWLLLGIVVLGATLLDVFLTALNYDESGFLAGPVMRWQWRSLRRVTRRLPRRWRPVALRQVTGMQVVVGIVLWVCGTILGYGLVYYGLMTSRSFSVSGTGAELDLFSSLYFSAAQLSTVGGSTLTAETDVLRFLSIAETLTGVLLLSLVLTFLLGVYGVIGDLNSLCTQFVTAERGAGTPVASLAPYFRDGEPNGLDGHLDAVGDAFASYTSGMRLHQAAYYFQSGRDRFALPYALRMISGTVAALRWGLPTGHPGAAVPRLVPLTFEYLELGDYLQRRVRWTSSDVPAAVPAGTFARLARGDAGHDTADPWAARFLQLDRDMAALAGVEPLADPDDTYRRYCAWLPFAYRAQQIALAVGRDLDYQPIIVSDRPVSLLRPESDVALRQVDEYLTGPALPLPHPAAGGRFSRWRAFVDDHLAQVDPGFARLRSAGRALLGAVAAGATGYLLVRALGQDDVRPAIFGAFVAMLSTGIAADRTVRARKVTSVLLLVPVAVVVLLGALASGSPVRTGVLVVLVAVVGTWLGRFGPRWAALGHVTFLVYYFALIMQLRLSEVALYVATAVLGVAWGFLLRYVVLKEHPARVLRAGVAGFGRQLVTSMDTLVDAVSWARWDPDVSRRVEVDQRRLQRGGTYLGGQLTGEPDATGVDPVRGAELRLRLFDTTLAAAHLAGAARDVTGTTLSLELRGRLAGRLQLLQAHLARLAAGPAAATGRPDREASLAVEPWDTTPPPAHWPRAARALQRATDELYRAARALADAELAALDPAAPSRPPVPGDDEDRALDEIAWTATTAQPATAHRLSQTSRRAVQAGVAVAAALGIGELVSSSHQYWATLAAYQVLGGTDGETFVKGAQRVGGTVAGAAIGFAVAIGTGHEPWVLVPLLAVAVFASTYFRQVSPAVSTLWTTMIFAVVYEFLGRLTPVALELRVAETLLGAAAALLVAWLVLPTRTRVVLDDDASVLVRDIATVVTTAVGRLDGSSHVSSRALQDRLLAIEREARTVSATAAPLRRAAGASGADGVEGRLTALWSLTYDTRHLVRAVEAALEAGPTGTEDWSAVRATLGENLTALLDALAGRLPGAVESDLPLLVGAHDVPVGPVDDVVRHLVRINDTVVVLVGDASPGAVGEREPAAPIGA
ncbi:FUSC family protein [Cellulomonas wangsupingiae]|uniref:FUSC family protein n=1 Tax=Cellulomonas wangsupingiae TaxID=2968085 RepID=UPI001D0EF818|nr:FUSC family protein [Cellulomonas wangsupingiae]MCM0641321.1 FUSC family protein [Cellulomonas wangsupingiae]